MEPCSPSVAECPGAALFEHLTSRWPMLVVMALSDGPLRYHALRGRVEGISDKMLSQTLKMLQRNGLVDRTVRPSAMIQVSYALSGLGEDLDAQLRGLRGWIGLRLPAVEQAQSRFDAVGDSAGLTRHRIA